MISFFGEPLGRGLFNAPRRNLGFPASMNQEVLVHVCDYRGRWSAVSGIPGSAVSFDVLMIGGEGDVKVGNPVLEGAKAEGKVVAQVKGEKIRVYKYKSKKNYHRTQGHRQPYTKVEITAINA